MQRAWDQCLVRELDPPCPTKSLNAATKKPIQKTKETQKTKIMASVPITSQQIDGEKVQTVADFIFLGSEITVNGDYSHEVKEACSLACFLKL